VLAYATDVAEADRADLALHWQLPATGWHLAEWARTFMGFME
jgi:hypothetical protein